MDSVESFEIFKEDPYDFFPLEEEYAFILLPAGAVVCNANFSKVISDYKEVIMEFCECPEKNLPATIETGDKVIHIPLDQSETKIKLIIIDLVLV